jgi:SEC-C motif-containing protein
MEQCPCSSGKDFSECCEPLIQGKNEAKTAEALMRSRYSAHVKLAFDYVHDTLHPSKRTEEDRQGADWSKKFDWQSLDIVRTEAGGPDDDTGIVEFIAKYRKNGKAFGYREVATFAREEGRWYFVDGEAPEPVQSVRKGPKIGRNAPCPCGSGKKYKKCCG